MVGDQDADALGPKLGHDVLDVLHGDGVDPGKGLIEQDEAGVGRQGPGNFRSALFSSAQHVAPVLPDVGQAEFLEQFLEACLSVGRVRSVQFEDGEDVVLHAEFAEDRSFLRQVADAALGASVHRFEGQVMGDALVVEEGHRSPVGLDESGHHVERGGLAGSVGPEKAHDLAGSDLETDLIDHFAATVLLDDGVGGQFHVAGGRVPSSACWRRWMRRA